MKKKPVKINIELSVKSCLPETEPDRNSMIRIMPIMIFMVENITNYSLNSIWNWALR